MPADAGQICGAGADPRRGVVRAGALRPAGRIEPFKTAIARLRAQPAVRRVGAGADRAEPGVLQAFCRWLCPLGRRWRCSGACACSRGCRGAPVRQPLPAVPAQLRVRRDPPRRRDPLRRLLPVSGLRGDLPRPQALRTAAARRQTSAARPGAGALRCRAQAGSKPDRRGGGGGARRASPPARAFSAAAPARVVCPPSESRPSSHNQALTRGFGRGQFSGVMPGRCRMRRLVRTSPGRWC